MTSTFKTFLIDEDGAAVVDMTMLMAALVGLAMAVTTVVGGGLEDLTGDTQAVLIAHDVGPAW